MRLLEKIKYRLKRSKLFRELLYLTPAWILNLRKVHSLTLEVSSACNLQCPFCPVGQGKIPQMFMDIATHKKIIDLLPRTIKTIRYSYRGDAALNRNFPEMLHYAHSKGFKTDFSTNGMLIDRYISEIVNSGLDRIIFAVDGASQEVQTKYRRGSDIEKIKKNIKALVSAREDSLGKFPKEIVIQTVVSRHNESEIPSLIELARELNVDKIKFKTLAVSLGSDFLKGKDFQKNFLPINKSYWRKGQDILLCPFLRETVILANGDVSICCNDYYARYIAGNILKENSFEKVVYGKRYNNLRKKIVKKGLPICQNCPITGEYWIPEISRSFRK